MIDAVNVSQDEVGVVRLFQVDITPSDLDRIKFPKPDTPPTSAAIANLVGLDWIEEGYAELFDVQDLEGLGLADYLVQGSGIDESNIAELRDTLGSIEGIVLILYSRAFGGNAYTLKPRRSLQTVAVLHESSVDITFKDLPSVSATEPSILGTPPAHPHLNVLKAMFILPAICFVIGLVVWLVFL